MTPKRLTHTRARTHTATAYLFLGGILNTPTLTETLALQVFFFKDLKRFIVLPRVSQIQTTEVTTDSSAQSVYCGGKENASTATRRKKSV